MKNQLINNIIAQIYAGLRTVSILLIFIAFGRVMSLNLIRKAFEESFKVEGSKFVLVVLVESLQAINSRNNKDSFKKLLISQSFYLSIDWIFKNIISTLYFRSKTTWWIRSDLTFKLILILKNLNLIFKLFQSKSNGW